MRAMYWLAGVTFACALIMGCEGQGKSEALGVAKDTQSAATETKAKEAQPLIDKASEAIQDGKLDQAQDNLTQLEGMKSSLPKSMQDKIASLEKSLNTAKQAKSAAQGLKLPGAAK